MSLDDFFGPRILIVSGKGGVGKTTVAASIALLAARRGRRVLIAEVDRKGSLPKLFSAGELGYDPQEISPGVWGMNIIPEAALAEYLRIQYHMKRISRIFTSTSFVDYITGAAPGLKDILVLGKIWYLEQGRDSKFDTIVVDAPAAGHMLTFLAAPLGLSDALRVGPLRRQSDWLVQMLRDPARCRVHLVTLPEEMPVTETVETAQALTERVGAAQGTVFANAVYDDLFTPEEVDLLSTMDASRHKALIERAQSAGVRLDEDDVETLLGYGRFLVARRDIQAEHLAELAEGVPAGVVTLPFLFSAGLSLPDLETLADILERSLAA